MTDEPNETNETPEEEPEAESVEPAPRPGVRGV